MTNQKELAEIDHFWEERFALGNREAKPRRIEVIEVVFRRGKGVVGDPVRIVTAYHSDDGQLLAENDPCAFAVTPPALP